MEKIDELKDIIWKLNLQMCNLVQYIDKNLSAELIDELIVRFNRSSDDKKRYFPLVIDTRELQKTFLGIDEKIIKYAEAKKIVIPNNYYELIELRKKAFNNRDLDVLRDFKKKIFALEKITMDCQVNDIKSILADEYFNNFFPYKLFHKYTDLNCLISEENFRMMKNKLDFLNNSDINLTTLLEMETIFYDSEAFYKFLNRGTNQYHIMVPVIIINGESIVDYELQETINYHMLNQRSGVFTMNFITEDTIYHRNYKNWYLEETHDIITTNVKSKRYYQDINR